MEDAVKLGIIIWDRYRSCAGENACGHCATAKAPLGGIAAERSNLSDLRAAMGVPAEISSMRRRR